MYREKGENNRKNRSFWWVLGLVWTEDKHRGSRENKTAGDLRIIVFCYKFPFYFLGIFKYPPCSYPAVFIWVHILTSLYAFTTTTFLIIKCLFYLYASILTAIVYTTYIILELDNIKHAFILIQLHCLYLHMLENWKRESVGFGWHFSCYLLRCSILFICLKVLIWGW